MRNIETGVSATADVNADRAKDIGISILKSIEGKCVSEFTLKENTRLSHFKTNLFA